MFVEMAKYDSYRFAYYRFIADNHLYPEFVFWCKEKGRSRDVKSMSLFLVHKGLRNDMIGNPRYDRDDPVNEEYRKKGLTPIFDYTDDEWKATLSAKW